METREVVIVANIVLTLFINVTNRQTRSQRSVSSFLFPTSTDRHTFLFLLDDSATVKNNQIIILCSSFLHTQQMKLRSSFGFLAAVVILDLQCKAFLPSSRSSTVTSRASFDGLSFINEGHLKLFAASSDDKSTLNSQVQNLKKVLAREYTSFFDPMETVRFT